MASVLRIGPVYTPPELRRLDHASTVVGALSHHLLDAGRRRVLYADPVSKLGVRPGRLVTVLWRKCSGTRSAILEWDGPAILSSVKGDLLEVRERVGAAARRHVSLAMWSLASGMLLALG